MSTKIHDFASQARLRTSLPPQTITSSVQGDSIDMQTADGPCFAIQVIGTVADDLTVTGKIQESADAGSWTDIPGATFAAVTEGPNTQTLRFDRSLRFVRYVVTISGGSGNVTLFAAIGQQYKTI